MNKLVRNERRKLTATLLNGIAIAAVGIGGLAQAASMIQAGGVSPSASIFALICLILAGVLHVGRRFSLGGLEE